MFVVFVVPQGIAKHKDLDRDVLLELFLSELNHRAVALDGELGNGGVLPSNLRDQSTFPAPLLNALESLFGAVLLRSSSGTASRAERGTHEVLNMHSEPSKVVSTTKIVQELTQELKREHTQRNDPVRRRHVLKLVEEAVSIEDRIGMSVCGSHYGRGRRPDQPCGIHLCRV